MSQISIFDFERVRDNLNGNSDFDVNKNYPAFLPQNHKLAPKAEENSQKLLRIAQNDNSRF